MTNKTITAAIALGFVWINATAAPFTGGIALEKTAKLAQKPIALPNADPKPLLALAARHGYAQGYISGKAADAIAKKFGKAVPINVTAKDKGSIKDQPGCRKVRLTYQTTPEFETLAPKQELDVAVCPN